VCPAKPDCFAGRSAREQAVNPPSRKAIAAAVDRVELHCGADNLLVVESYHRCRRRLPELMAGDVNHFASRRVNRHRKLRFAVEPQVFSWFGWQ
jgi:hypothetical protein